ncbi:MAG: hypothetical protein WCG44_01170 [bacterium]
MSYANPYLELSSDNSEKDLINWFLNYDIKNYSSDFSDNPNLAEKIAYARYSFTYNHVSAYKQFLLQNGWTGKSKIQSHKQWLQIPLMDKKNYISKNQLNLLVSTNGDSILGKIISLSSGSSGNATFWPRGSWQEIEGGLLHEKLLLDCFQIDKHKTLFVVSFAMGSYLAGTYTANSVRWVASKGYDLTVISPGIGSQDGLKMITELAPFYDQIILAGYPPFIKDLLEEGSTLGIDWAKLNIKLMMASEFFSEKWREGIAKLAGIDDATTGTTNIFGASEGTMFGWETPEAIIIRREAFKNKELHKALFNSELTPTLVEYNPDLRYFEVVDGKLILTALGGVPLIRYDLKDNGGILTMQRRRQILLDFGIDITKMIPANRLTELPMVYILGRADQAASIYGVLIYPEYIKSALEDEDRITGKFTMITGNIGVNNAELQINIELKKDKKRTQEFANYLEEKIKLTLISKSHEYSALESVVGEKCWPHITLYPKNDSKYFGSRIKQKWIKS